jgi:hypothetical protein
MATHPDRILIIADTKQIAVFQSDSIRIHDLRTRQVAVYNTPQIDASAVDKAVLGKYLTVAAVEEDGSSTIVMRDLGSSCRILYVVNIRSSVKRSVWWPSLLAAVSETSISLFQTSDGLLLRRQQTFANPNAACAISADIEKPVMCCLGLQRGTLRIERLGDNRSSSVIAVHEAAITNIAISGNGAYVSTISENGSIIRVHSTMEPCDLVVELRRSSLLGAPIAQDMFMSPTGSFIGIIEGGSISIFKTPIESVTHLVGPVEKNENSPFSFLNSISTVCSKCMSIAIPGSAAWVSLRVPSMNAELISVSASFGPDPYTLVVASQSTAATTAFVYRFDPKESGSIHLARCETLSSGAPVDLQDEVVEVTKTYNNGANTPGTLEDWVFLSPSGDDHYSISW